MKLIPYTLLFAAFSCIVLFSCKEKYAEPVSTINIDTVDLGPLPDTGVWLFHSHHIASALSSDYDKKFMDQYITYRFTFNGHNIYSENDINSIKDTGYWDRRVVNNIKYYDITFKGNDSLLTWYNDSWNMNTEYYSKKHIIKRMSANDKIFMISHISTLNDL